jgi:hypothetical protein
MITSLAFGRSSARLLLGLGGIATVGFLASRFRTPVQRIIFFTSLVAACASAFFVGVFSGLGINFLRLADKISLLSDLLFYAAIISALLSPVMFVSALVDSADKHQKQEEAKAQKQLQGSTKAKYAISRIGNRLRNWKTDAEGARKASSVWAQIALLLMLAVASLILLGASKSIPYAIFVLLIGALFKKYESTAAALSGAAICALVFGFLHADHLRELPPDTSIVVTGRAEPIAAIVVMNAAAGIIVLAGPDKKIMLVPWSTVASLESSTQPELVISAAMLSAGQRLGLWWGALRSGFQRLLALGPIGGPR